VRSTPGGFKVICGDDNLALAAIGIGAHGLASVASNEAPAEIARLVRAALRNEWPLAREIERKYTRLFEANFWDSNPGPAKTILSMMGRCEDTVRLPLVKPDRATRQRLERVAGELGLLRNAPLPEGDMRMF
jgi:4-hydroxy-tetrahydrodipicolinate synthase